MEENAWTPLKDGVITEQYARNVQLIREAAHSEESEDVILRQFEAMGQKAALLYVDGLTDGETLQRFLLDPLLKAAPPADGTPLDTYLTGQVLPLSSVTPTTQLSTLLNRVFSGDAALIVDTMPGALIADAKGFVKRGVSEPVNESVVAGPHEGFTESLRDNTVLLRRLLRTPALISEQMTVGSKVPVRLCMLYLDGVARK